MKKLSIAALARHQPVALKSPNPGTPPYSQVQINQGIIDKPPLVLGPVVEELAGELAGQAKVGKLNIDAYPGIASKYGVRSIPTVLIFDKGKVADSTIGVVPKQTLRDKINGLVSAA